MEVVMTTDNDLLRRYVEDQSEPAFTALVERHIALVYSAALRQVSGDVPAAQDVTQAVFCDLARQGRRLMRHPSLAGWLYTSTRFLAAKTRRAERRRHAREQHTHPMNEPLGSAIPDLDWRELRPVLDDAMHDLSETDREAVLLRYFQERPLAEIGSRLGLTENAARMRVDRALEKLRDALAKRGVTSTVSVLALGLAQYAVVAAPEGLALQVGRAALLAGGTGGVGWLAGIHSVMSVARSPLLISGAAVAVVAVGVWLAWPKRSGVTPSEAVELSSTVPASVVATTTPADAGTQTAGEADVAVSSTGDELLLDIVTADTGQAVPGVEVEYWRWDGTRVERNTLLASRLGQCVVPVPRGSTTQLILVSQCDGFADTRLAWRPDRGEAIPERYLLRVARSVPISGRVVDADGQPVAGAEVGFNNRADPAQETRPQSDNFDWPFWITANTDAAGQWRIDRIAEATIKTIDGGASHPEHVQSESAYPSQNPEAARQLIEGTHVFRLGRAVVARGVVVNSDGQPIADAKVAVGPVGHSGRRETTTLADGTFSVVGCRPGQNPLSAGAPGYAPATMIVELAEDSAPFRLTLAQGGLLRLRVVNTQGNPIPQANVWYDTFGRFPGEPRGGSPVQTEFSRKTDADGRVEWDGAPDRELDFDIAAPGYMRRDEITVRPDGTEHEIVMTPALTISGTVTDDQTGEPIPRFRILTGWPTPIPGSGTMGATWSSIDRFWLSFEGGQFRHVYEEPVVGGVKDRGFMFKFEAEDYAPVVSRVVKADEMEVRFDVRLRPAQSVTVTVLQPDGAPAANADVGLVSPGARLELSPGRFSRQRTGSGGNLLTADGQGQFRLPPDDTIVYVIAVLPTGIGESTPAELKREPTMRLQPWGCIEGTFQVDGKPTAGQEVQLEYGVANLPRPVYQAEGDGLPLPMLGAVHFEFGAYVSTTGPNGEFAFSQAPPGRHRLIRRIETAGWPGNHEGRVWRLDPLGEVMVTPGETTKVVLEGSVDEILTPGRAAE
jgi:RNA polymerase sigma factor (sigma-70 family)